MKLIEFQTGFPKGTIGFKIWDAALKPVLLTVVTLVLFVVLSNANQAGSKYLMSQGLINKLTEDFIGLLGILFSLVLITYVTRVLCLKEKFNESPVSFKGSLKDTGYGFLCGFVVFGVVVLVSWFLGIYSITGFYWDTHSLSEVVFFFSSSLLTFAIVGLAEEFLFRVTLFQYTEESWGTITALIISSVLFGAVHMGNKEATWVGAIAIMVEAGIFLGAAYMLTRKIWFVAGIHWSWNLTQGPIFGSVISGSSSTQDGLFISKMEGSEWLTGGKFGPEAGLPAMIICTSVGIYFLIIAYRKGKFKKAIWNRPNVSPDIVSSI